MRALIPARHTPRARHLKNKELAHVNPLVLTALSERVIRLEALDHVTRKLGDETALDAPHHAEADTLGVEAQRPPLGESVAEVVHPASAQLLDPSLVGVELEPERREQIGERATQLLERLLVCTQHQTVIEVAQVLHLGITSVERLIGFC